MIPGRDSCAEHGYYKVNCPHCYRARLDKIKAETPPKLTAPCPSCRAKADMQFRWENDDAGSIRYAYLECGQCGTRSKEVLGDLSEQKKLVMEWSEKP